MASLSQKEADALRIARARAGITQAGKAVETFRQRLAKDTKLSRLEAAVRKATSGPLRKGDSRIASQSRLLDKLFLLAVLGLVGTTILLYKWKG